jgi:hypothetical protein
MRKPTADQISRALDRTVDAYLDGDLDLDADIEARIRMQLYNILRDTDYHRDEIERILEHEYDPGDDEGAAGFDEAKRRKEEGPNFI